MFFIIRLLRACDIDEVLGKARQWGIGPRAGPTAQRHDRTDFRASVVTEHPHLPTPLLRHLRESRMNSAEKGDIGGFKVPSIIPQDLLLIHDLVGGDLSQASSSSPTQAAGANDASIAHTAKSEEEDADSIGSSSSDGSLDERGDVDMSVADVPMKEEGVDKGADSEEEVEAGLLNRDDGGDPMTM